MCTVLYYSYSRNRTAVSFLFYLNIPLYQIYPNSMSDGNIQFGISFSLPDTPLKTCHKGQAEDGHCSP